MGLEQREASGLGRQWRSVATPGEGGGQGQKSRTSGLRTSMESTTVERPFRACRPGTPVRPPSSAHSPQPRAAYLHGVHCVPDHTQDVKAGDDGLGEVHVLREGE